jgi:preprotein translocase subunit SecE
MSDASRQRFRRTLMSVMVVQVITLLLLWLLQQTFSA